MYLLCTCVEFHSVSCGSLHQLGEELLKPPPLPPRRKDALSEAKVTYAHRTISKSGLVQFQVLCFFCEMEGLFYWGQANKHLEKHLKWCTVLS